MAGQLYIRNTSGRLSAFVLEVGFFLAVTAAQNAITLPDDGITRTNLGDDSILEYGYTTAPGATMLFEVWKKQQPSSVIANKANNGSFNVFAAWRGRAEPVGQASLKLFSVTKDDAGQYQLSTTFSDGTSDSKERTLIVQFAPEDTTVTAAPGLIAMEGDAQVVLTCQSGGIPAPTYTWTGDNLPADAAQDPNTGTLTITNIQRSAAGQYTCTADNGVPQLPGDNPTALTNSVNVQVQYGPSSATITRDPADKVVQWSTVILSCAVDTTNPPATYTWTRVNGTLPTNTDVDQIAGTLRLRSIQPNAVGTYRCSATNRIGDPAIATHVIDEVEEEMGHGQSVVVWAVPVSIISVVLLLIVVAAFFIFKRRRATKQRGTSNDEYEMVDPQDSRPPTRSPQAPATVSPPLGASETQSAGSEYQALDPRTMCDTDSEYTSLRDYEIAYDPEYENTFGKVYENA